MQSIYKYCYCSSMKSICMLPIFTLNRHIASSITRKECVKVHTSTSAPQRHLCPHTGVFLPYWWSSHNLLESWSLHLDLRCHSWRFFFPFSLLIFIDFFFWFYLLVLLLATFQIFKNQNTFGHPYLLPQFVSTPLKQNCLLFISTLPILYALKSV